MDDVRQEGGSGRNGQERKEKGRGRRKERERGFLSLFCFGLTLQCEHVTAGAVATILCLKGQVKRIKETQAWLPELT